MKKKTAITPKEASIIIDCANQMNDDFMDYYTSMYGKAKARILYNRFLSGMSKLQQIVNPTN